MKPVIFGILIILTGSILALYLHMVGSDWNVTFTVGAITGMLAGIVASE